MRASGMQRLITSMLLASAIVLAGCLVSAGAQDAHAAVAAVAASSPSAGALATSAPPPSPTPTVASPTAAPTTASPTTAPSTASPTPSPSSSSTSSGGLGNLIWLWFVLGALVLLGIILLATRSPSRSSAPGRSPVEATNWHSRAVDAYAKGAAFDGAVRTAERLDVSSEAASIHWADLRRRADDLTEVLYAMRETAPTDHRRAQVENAILSLRAVRDAFEAQRPPGGAASQQGGVLRSQLSALESALNALRIPDDRL
jgi:hypothetical protein